MELIITSSKNFNIKTFKMVLRLDLLITDLQMPILMGQPCWHFQKAKYQDFVMAR